MEFSNGALSDPVLVLGVFGRDLLVLTGLGDFGAAGGGGLLLLGVFVDVLDGGFVVSVAGAGAGAGVVLTLGGGGWRAAGPFALGAAFDD